MSKKIKIGIIIKHYQISLWEYRVLEKIVNSDFAEINFVIKIQGDGYLPDNKRSSILYRLQEQLDRLIFRNKFDYDNKVSILNLINDVPSISYFSKNKNGKNNLSEEINNWIQVLNISVILNFGFKLSNSNSFKAPRYGIWTFIAGDNKVAGGFSAGYWEIVKKIPEIVGTVRIIRDNDWKENVIYRAGLSTYPNSINVNRNQLFALAGLIIPRILRGLFIHGNSYIEKLINKFNNENGLHNPESIKSPSSFAALKNLVLIFIRYLCRKIFFLKIPHWSLLFQINNKNNFPPDTLKSFRELIAPKGKFWADPFVIAKNNKYYLFIEEYIYIKNKGHISVLELDDRGILLSSERIINKPYHMSYPFIFEFNSRYYMIPETSANKTIDLYHCIDFPSKWEFVMNLIEPISSVDSTLFFHDNKWWLFTSVDEMGNKAVPFNELFLFFSHDLFSGHWQSHPDNPIISELKTSRSAGRIFTLNNKIYRPSQDCSGRYGKALNINQITKLSEIEYEEILISRIEPKRNKKLSGIHTFNFDNNITVLDASSLGKRVSFNLLKRDSVSAGFHIRDFEIREQKKSRIKILFYIDGLTSGGKERRLTELMKGLKLLPDYYFELVLMNKKIHYEEVLDLGIKIHYIIRKKKKDISVFYQFYKICKEYRPDIVHCWDSMTAMYLVPVCKYLKIKIVNGMVVDTPVKQNVSNKHWFRARLTFPFSDIVVGNSKAGLEAYRAPLKKSICIYNGMDLKRFENLKDKTLVREQVFGEKTKDIFIVGMVAAFEPRKDYRTLISAAITLISSFKEIRFILVGSGVDFDKIKSLIPSSLQDKIVLLGNRSDIESIVNIFDVGILLTNTKVHGEGISNSIIEYMALGKPVIATHGGGTNEVVINYRNGFLIDDNNTEQLVEKITVIFEDRRLINGFGKKGRQMVEEKFDVKIMTKQYAILYKELMN